MSKKILFFLDSLRSGGRERRAIELFYFLKKETDFEFQIVLVEDIIHYDYIYDIDVSIHKLKKRVFKKDPLPFFSFFLIVKEFKPDIIHTWSAMTTFYAIPSSKCFSIPIVNGQIANAIPREFRSRYYNYLWKINSFFSDFILANSNAGLKAYTVSSEKGTVIHNGINSKRFEDLKKKELIKKEFGLETIYTVVMIASYNNYKDYSLFFDIANKVCALRNDTTFIGVGEGLRESHYFIENEKNERIIVSDKISNIEDLVNVCDIGVLFSNIQTGEGFPNAVMEYMALGKSVIATDAGGTKELVDDNVSGFLVNNNKVEIINKINLLLNNPNLRKQMGGVGRQIIEQSFTLNQMGKKFVEIYGRI